MERKPLNKLKFGSIWDWEHYRAGQLIDKWTEKNIVTDEGLTHALDVVFSDGTQKNDWYVALFNNDYTPDGSETYQTPVYVETVGYDEASRPDWTEAGVSSQQITNSASRATFTMNSGETIYGAALVSADTPGDAASGEVLFCVSKFSSGGKATIDDDVLKVTVTITASDV